MAPPAIRTIPVSLLAARRAARPLRSLRLWMAFRTHGAAQYRIWLEGTLENARRLTALVRASPDFELLHEPMLSTVCFRHLPGDGATPGTR